MSLLLFLTVAKSLPNLGDYRNLVVSPSTLNLPRRGWFTGADCYLIYQTMLSLSLILSVQLPRMSHSQTDLLPWRY